MPTTSNFGWTTPADTDLVKDGAAAIRTLGNGIDSSLIDLKGGTTGQVLSKASNTDLDYSWVTPNVGDITEVQGGTGITVTNGTGPIPSVALSTPVAATNGGTAQSTYATGDLLYASAANTLAKRAIGTTGQVLTVSGGVPTWATASGGDWVKITTPGANSGATEISNTSFTSTYMVYCLVFRRLRLSGTADLQFRFRDTGEITTSNYNGNTFGYTNANALRTNGMNNTSFIDLGIYDGGNSSGYLYIITNQNDVNVVPSVIGQMYSTETNTAFSIGAAFNGSPGTIQGFRLFLSTGTFNDTRCDLYGLK